MLPAPMMPTPIFTFCLMACSAVCCQPFGGSHLEQPRRGLDVKSSCREARSAGSWGCRWPTFERDFIESIFATVEVADMAAPGQVEVIPESFSYVFSPYRDPVARVRAGER